MGTAWVREMLEPLARQTTPEAPAAVDTPTMKVTAAPVV